MRNISRIHRLTAVLIALGALILAPSCARTQPPAAPVSTAPLGPHPVSLMDFKATGDGWEFSNGQEFPGAVGSLTVDPAAAHGGQDTLKVAADFTKGGNYVAATARIPELEISDFSLWMRNPDNDVLTFRIEDGSGQTHQIRYSIQKSDDWQHVVFPLQQFFAHQGQPDAVTGITHYENWGGANDGKWHGPAKSLTIVVGHIPGVATRTLWFNDVEVTALPDPASLPKVTSTVALDDVTEGDTDWSADHGQVSVEPNTPDPGKNSLKFTTTTEKNNIGYLSRNLAEFEFSDVTAFHFRARSSNVSSFSVQLKDGTGQTHQIKGVPIVDDGQWHDVTLEPKKIAGIEHWAGANDGKWHGAPLGITLVISAGSDTVDQAPSLELTAITADAVQTAIAEAPAYKENFEASAQLPAGWTASGDTSIDATTAFGGTHSLVLARQPGPNQATITATGPAFPVSPGQWQLSFGEKSALGQADDSYSGAVNLQLLDGGGTVTATQPLGSLYGLHDWQPVTQTAEIPAGTPRARFEVELRKPSGKFWVDELSASYLKAVPHKDKRVVRLAFATKALGNLWLPSDPRTVEIRVESTKPLLDVQRTVSYEVRDYWGAEQTPPATVTVTRNGKDGPRFLYTADIDLSQVPLETGRYYELHGFVPQPNDEPFHSYAGFAIEPEAITHKYKPEDVPFTARDWDDRIPAFQELADRIGIRYIDLWGGWSEKPPYEPYAPGIEFVQKQGLGWLTGSPASTVEGGKTTYDEAALRGGVDTFLAKYGSTRPLVIDLGNEPHGTGAQVLANVAAYKAIYEEVKKVDPTVPVLATSVEPNEEYFKDGYGQYCDIYDFHIYEDSSGIVNAVAAYTALMNKYHVVHPIWITEMGLNSQGMSRDVVASELVKKFAVAFGAGASWFDFLYPDGDGSNAASAGAAHDIFDSRYNLYNPKLTAIADYDVINAIAVKKYVARQHYPDGINDYLFRDKDGNALQILWTDHGRADTAIALPGVTDADLQTLDGSHHALNAGGKALTLTVSDQPEMLLYSGGPATLPANLGTPAATLTTPAMALRGGTTLLQVATEEVPASEVNLVAPPFWTVTKTAGKGGVQFAVVSPENSAARDAEFAVTLGPDGNRSGELTALIPVSGKMSAELLPVPATGSGSPGVKVVVTNNGSTPEPVNWSLTLDTERFLSAGKFGNPTAAGAHFDGSASGTATVPAHGVSEQVVPLAGADPLRIYHMAATVTDSSGHAYSADRFVGGFVNVPRLTAPLKLDGVLDEPAWVSAPVQTLNTADQIQDIDGKMAPWKGPQNLSATLRYLWDDQYLYVGVDETHDIMGKLEPDDMLWASDGLQLLVDPSRESDEKPGKYDIALGVGINGPRAWIHSSADASVPAGLAKDIIVSAQRHNPGTGNITYEVAIPWKDLAPFAPHPGADLGLSLAINADDGTGRHGFMTWFGDVQAKSLDTVGDLVLGK